jgi:hypothetical protein
MKAALNDFIKKPRKVKEDLEPQTKLRNKKCVGRVDPGHGEGNSKSQGQMNPFKAGRQQNPDSKQRHGFEKQES